MNNTTLEKFMIGMEQRIAAQMLSPSVIIEFQPGYYDQIEMKLRGYIWSEPLQHLTIQYPANWWEGVKKRWFTPRMLTRWPVLYTVHEIDIKTLYPNYRPSIPDQEYTLGIYHDSFDGLIE